PTHVAAPIVLPSLFFSLLHPPPPPTLFPYTTLFRSVIRAVLALATGWDMRDKPPHRLDWSAAHLFRLDESGEPSIARLNVALERDRKSTRLNSSHRTISYAVFCLKKKKKKRYQQRIR